MTGTTEFRNISMVIIRESTTGIRMRHRAAAYRQFYYYTRCSGTDINMYDFTVPVGDSSSLHSMLSAQEYTRFRHRHRDKPRLPPPHTSVYRLILLLYNITI